MSLPFLLHSLAEGDVVSGWEWYEQQQPGLGDRFVAAVGAAIASACRWPNTGTPTTTTTMAPSSNGRSPPPGFLKQSVHNLIVRA